MQPLFSDAHFADLLARLRGHSVGLVHNRHGNWGDGLIERATLELFRRNGVVCRLLREKEISTGRWPEGITLIAEPGGGNLGARPGLASPRRRKLLAALAGPKIILPQTASDAGEDLSAFETVYVREETSLRILRTAHADVRLVPDLALLLEFPPSSPIHEEGLFLRGDLERLGAGGTDPAKTAASVEEYVRLAGSYRRVVTNRLHFAVAALLQGQVAVLRPSNYHKNLSMFETWLHRFPNCFWGG